MKKSRKKAQFSKKVFLNSKDKGRDREKKVCQYLIQRGWTILFTNQKVLGVEIDILAQKNKEKLVVEVKSISNPNQIEKILKPEQKERLQKVTESLYENHLAVIRLFLATVDQKNQIDFFEIQS